ncbi:MAG: hypothetical protein ACP5NY_04035 [Thermocladium sp.]
MNILSDLMLVMAGAAPGLAAAVYFRNQSMDSKILKGFLIYLMMSNQQVIALQLRSTVAPNLYLAVRGGWQYIIRVEPDHILRNQFGGRIAFAVGNAIMGSSNVHVVTGATIDPSLAIDYDLIERFRGASGEGRIEGGDRILDVIRLAQAGAVDVRLRDPAYGATISYTIDLRRLAARLLRDASETTSSMSQSFAYVSTVSRGLSAAIKSLASAEAVKTGARSRLLMTVGIIMIMVFVLLYVFIIK